MGEDETIRGILQRIHATWKGVAETPRQEPAEELEKTRVLSLGGTKQPPQPGIPEEESGGEEEVFVETVIVTSAGAPGGPASPPAPPASPATAHAEQEGKPAGEEETEGLEKTVFLDTTKLRGKGRDGSKK
jgi:hypothetical protein